MNGLWTFSISARDPDGDSIVYYASDMPLGATFAGDTFSWKPGYNQAGSYDVTFVASDSVLGDMETITISVANTNIAPALKTIGDKLVAEGTELSFAVVATDPDADALSYSAQNLPAGALFSNGMFTWTPDFGQA